MTKRVTRKLQIHFSTPAFLGNAEQSGQWRTPPIKALLRQWWRVAYAADQGYEVNLADMRREEGLLFGHAWLENDRFERDGRQVATAARKSGVRLRLMPLGGNGEGWQVGTQSGVSPMNNGLDTSYAWFGLVKRGKDLPDRTAIKADHQNESYRILQLAFPETHAKQLDDTLRLIKTFGTLGARSRGGWGSLCIDEVDELTNQDMTRYCQPIKQSLQRDWAVSLACDERGPWIWQKKIEKSGAKWHEAMTELARRRKEVRTALKVDTDLRPALGFAGQGRMPSPLRWKIIDDADGLTIRIFAMPHQLPSDSGKKLSEQLLQRAWGIVRDELDKKLKRL